MKSPRFSSLVPLILGASFAVAGEPVLKSDFSASTLPEGWAAMKGEWKVVDGTLVGGELASDKHAAVFSIPDPHANSTLRFRVRIDGAKGFHLSYNHPKGHLFRIRYADGVASLATDKDKKDPASKGEVLATATVNAKPGEWIGVTCEVQGDQVKVNFGGATLSGTHESLAKEKTGYRFVVQGASVVFDDVAFASSK
jgi:glycerophosphoryl diester phosphodiesterase